MMVQRFLDKCSGAQQFLQQDSVIAELEVSCSFLGTLVIPGTDVLRINQF